jgi:LmbE family N-acetylglucosaminyl deacetylase
MNVLLLSPHPDDIELTMGATALRLAKQHELYIYCFCTCGIVEEFQTSIGLINAKWYDLDYSILLRNFNKKRQKILDIILNLKAQIQPDLVFMPNLSDCHQDHKVVAEEAYRAFKHTDLISYIHPQNITEIRPNYFIEFSESEINEKIKLLSVYESQKERNYMKLESVKGTALFYGTMSGRRFCEAFEIIRKFN